MDIPSIGLHKTFTAANSKDLRDQIRDYAIKNGQLILNEYSAVKFANPGATPSISADGTKNATGAVGLRGEGGKDDPGQRGEAGPRRGVAA